MTVILGMSQDRSLRQGRSLFAGVMPTKTKGHRDSDPVALFAGYVVA
jgi:hypothetical protein